MSVLSHMPVYNLSAVLKETGLQADVLRAWERRYELPRPQRTAGGHRLYSEYDVALVKWLRARQAEGLSISRAASLWKNLCGAGRDPLAEAGPDPAPQSSTAPFGESRIAVLRDAWLKACLAFDTLKAEEALNQAFAIFPVEVVCFEVLQRGISEIGSRWHQGQVTVQQEYFATAIAMRRLETLISAAPNPTRPQTILVGCPPGEWHTFSTLLLTLMLRRRGLNVVYLGANIPLDQMEQTAAAIRPALIVLAAQQLSSAAALRSAAVLFQGLGLPLAYGGLVFNLIPELSGRIPAYFLGETLMDSIERIEQLAASNHPAPEAAPVDRVCIETAAALRVSQPRIEAALMDRLGQAGLPPANLIEVNAFFGAKLAAALELGSPAYMETDLEWVKKLLADRKIPAAALDDYLGAYRESVSLVMGKTGGLITSWLNNYLASH